MSDYSIGEVVPDVEEDDKFESESSIQEEHDVGGGISSHVQSAQDSVQEAWLSGELESQLMEVMSFLENKRRRWDDSQEPGNVELLEPYKKEALLEGRDEDPTRATALHIMASNYVLHGYNKIPEELIGPVIRDLLAEYLAPSNQTETEEEKKKREEPILKMAIKWRDNYGFVQLIKNSSPRQHLAALLAAQDGDDRNALHHIFAWPDDKLKRVPEADAEKVLTRALDLVPLATAETLAAKDKDGNTPIHYAADPRQSRGRDSRYVNLFKEMVERADPFMRGNKAFNNMDESPLRYAKRMSAHLQGTKRPKRDCDKVQGGAAVPTTPSASSTDPKRLASQTDLTSQKHLRLQHIPQSTEKTPGSPITQKHPKDNLR